MKKLLQFSLRTFLICTLLVAVCTGVLGRHYFREKTLSYRGLWIGIDRWKIHSYFRITSKKEEMMFILMIPDGQRTVLTSGEVDADMKNRTIDNGVTLSTRGLFGFDEKQIPGSTDGHIWIYRTSKKAIDKVNVPQRYKLPSSIKEFTELEKTTLWREVLEPAMVEESADWHLYWQEKRRKSPEDAFIGP